MQDFHLSRDNNHFSSRPGDSSGAPPASTVANGSAELSGLKCPGSPELAQVLAVTAAADDLMACREANTLLKVATEIARNRLGLERVGLYMRERNTDRIIMRGTWGTGSHGETTDEHNLFHEYGQREYQALLEARLAGGLGMYHAKAPLFASDTGRTRVIGEGWMMATPLVAANDVVGVMYNDAAITRSPVDESKQAAAALLCTLLAVLYQSKRGSMAWQPLPRKAGQSPLVERILQALRDDLPMTGERLAGEFGVSPGHLARTFKREMGVSLVDYRNRLRIDRFFETVQRGEGGVNLLDAALAAGFGSYAQFHRVYRKFLGTTPREILANGGAGGARAFARQYAAARQAGASELDGAAAHPAELEVPSAAMASALD